MKINNPEFVCSTHKREEYPFHNLPEVALAGRSNVGKSSLINKVINRRKLAFTSSKPGKTQSINFYKMDNYFYFVDLPGYGFAKVPDKVKEEWGVMIENYLFNRSHLEGVILVIDSRHKPTNDDLMMYDWLLEMNMPTLIVATKVDKLKRSQRRQQEKLIKERLHLTPFVPFTFFSAKTGEGKKEVFKFINQFID
ncbi:ribosome biogenesis GTP-binding protein YsxC/EngB [Halobacteroides halobius DSM 5150]|uniref:Probable GTP-binding protein EngB n=1 Tax=Halobacteroides halobius (strain ATCC 35273 / DSM 5150 / MD-1) TaxID=748449 RepID=L0KCX0_HALHC|nr:ribosome biogenesis GTP-binding protein YihA/YsxC [Halobacteroides halobius]AGB41923.1 ribosome biogenesis GTP-binding protein YsxC/EngB [Halobacteroides halobius DSM 5150]